MSFETKIKKLTKQLYPKGRAFRMPLGGAFDKLHTALGKSEARAYTDAVGILNSILPDTDNFTAEDATQWEQRLGLVSNSSVSLSDRKLAILRKMNHPGEVAARQHYLYLQGQLRAAGFDVYVYENRFDAYPDTYETKTVQEVTDEASSLIAQLGDFQLGDFQLGGDAQKVVNNIYSNKDALFDVGDNLRSTFFIGGEATYTPDINIPFADVDADRELEFRQLILKIKPVQTVAYLLINYI